MSIADLGELGLAGREPPPRVLMYDDSAQTEPSPYQIFSKYLRDRLEERYRSDGYHRVDDPCSTEAANTQPNQLVRQVSTSGSLDSLIQLDDYAKCSRKQPNKAANRGTIAIVQADVVHHYLLGDHPQFLHGRPDSAVRSIARVFPERLELAWTRFGEERPELPCPAGSVCDAEVLAERKICAGSVGSGTLVTMLNLARALPAAWRDLHGCPREKTGAKALNDAGWLLTANATGYKRKPPELRQSGSGISEPTERQPIGLSRGSVRVLESGLQGGPAGIYQAQPLDASNAWTLRWDAVLVSNRDLSNEALGHVTSAIDELARLCEHKPGVSSDPASRIVHDTWFCDIPAAERHRGLPIALHPTLMLEGLDGASKLVASLTDPVVLKLVLVALLGLSLIAGVVPLVGPAVRLSARRPQMTRLANVVIATQSQWIAMLLTAAAFHLLIGVLVWLSELHSHALNSDVEYVEGGLWRAVDWMFHFVILNSSDIELKSTLALAWVGLLKAGWAVASGALFVGLVQAGLRGWRALHMGEHVVVVGWNGNGLALVRELERARVEYQLFVGRIHMNAGLTNDIMSRARECPRGLLKSLMADALLFDPRGVIVLADEQQAADEGTGDVDMWVARQVLDIQSARAERQPNAQRNNREPQRVPQLVAEVQHDVNVEVVARLGADEVVCVRRFGTELLAQAATKLGVRAVLEDLLRTQRGTHELYIDPLSLVDVWRYRSFERLARAYASSGRSRIPLGIVRAAQPGSAAVPILNPIGAAARLRPGDKLIAMASNPQALGADEL